MSGILIEEATNLLERLQSEDESAALSYEHIRDITKVEINNTLNQVNFFINEIEDTVDAAERATHAHYQRLNDLKTQLETAHHVYTLIEFSKGQTDKARYGKSSEANIATKYIWEQGLKKLLESTDSPTKFAGMVKEVDRMLNTWKASRFGTSKILRQSLSQLTAADFIKYSTVLSPAYDDVEAMSTPKKVREEVAKADAVVGLAFANAGAGTAGPRRRRAGRSKLSASTPLLDAVDAVVDAVNALDTAAAPESDSPKVPGA